MENNADERGQKPEKGNKWGMGLERQAGPHHETYGATPGFMSQG